MHYQKCREEKGTGYIEEDAGCMGTERKRARGAGVYIVQKGTGCMEEGVGCRRVWGAEGTSCRSVGGG